MGLEKLQRRIAQVIKTIERTSDMGHLIASWLKERHPDVRLDVSIWPEPDDNQSIESMCFDLCFIASGPFNEDILDELNDWLSSKGLKMTANLVYHEGDRVHLIVN